MRGYSRQPSGYLMNMGQGKNRKYFFDAKGGLFKKSETVSSLV
jgi:hypothetical protein